MKIKAFIATGLLFLFSPVMSFAEAPKDPLKISKPDMSGMEWLQVSINKRSECIVASMYLLKTRGVPLSRSADEYDHAVSEELRYNPNYYDLTVTNILAGVVYKTEPEARKAIDEIKKMQTQKIEMH